MKNVSDTLYVRLVLVKSPENAVIQARRCWATPFADPEGPTQFTLIDDFCSAPVANAEQDPQVDVQKNGESTYAEWTSKVFAFAGQSERVYVHCIARVCFEGPDQPSCNKVPCLGNRKRRAAYGGIGEISSDGQRTAYNYYFKPFYNYYYDNYYFWLYHSEDMTRFNSVSDQSH